MEFIAEEEFLTRSRRLRRDTVDGRFSKEGIVGVECKDQAYGVPAMPYRDMPASVPKRQLKARKHAQGYKALIARFISTEIRVSPDGKAILDDPCARCDRRTSGSSISDDQGNLALMFCGEGAPGGILIDPELIKAVRRRVAA